MTDDALWHCLTLAVLSVAAICFNDQYTSNAMQYLILSSGTSESAEALTRTMDM